MRSRILPPYLRASVSGTAQVETKQAGWPKSISPNFSDWQRGDILLVHASGTPKDWAIQTGQKLSFNRATRDGANFVHAGIYVGGTDIVDVTTSLGLAQRSVWAYAETCPLALMRLAGKSKAERERISDCAVAWATGKQPYSLLALLMSKLVPNTTPDRDHLYCSTFVGKVVEDGCTLQLHGPLQYRPLYPGTLSEHAALDRVGLEWRRCT